MFKDGDIVMDFLHSRFIVWKPEYRKLFNSCRLATEWEAERFKKFRKDVVTFREFVEGLKVGDLNYHYKLNAGRQYKWIYRDSVTVPVTLKRWQIFHLEEIKRKKKLKNYTEVIDELLRNYNPSLEQIYKELLSKAEDEKNKLREVYQTLKTIFTDS